MNFLSTIFNSDKIHLTHSQKNFIKETYEILSIFRKDINKIIKEKFKSAMLYSNNKFKNGKIFFEEIYKLRYPITYKKLTQLRKFKIFSLEIDINQTNIYSEKEISEIKNILTTL
ncbi:MAG: hypothetical protein RMJ67_04650 [Elusimicrobiota bacterium]|nr:hypothetical protein [Endomicrobiia bacterium]MCX7911270.1 hypothetical protein [Endomicrobiia bacterium]MDW8165782.1 hypothetical protein [Elusimicrobiota bacterium]